MINQDYVNWLVTWIKERTINIKTGQPFVIDDIKSQEYKDAVANEFKVEVANGTITQEQYKIYTGVDYVA